MASRKIMIVEDDKEVAMGLALLLRKNGYEVAWAADAITAISVANKEKPELVILDLGLPGGDGLLVMDRMNTLQTLVGIPIIVYSGQDPTAYREMSIKKGAYAYFQKPVENNVLLETIKKALDAQNTAGGNSGSI